MRMPNGPLSFACLLVAFTISVSGQEGATGGQSPDAGGMRVGMSFNGGITLRGADLLENGQPRTQASISAD